VLIGLTDDGYKVLSTNMSDIMTLISQQNQIIAAYQNYYEKSEQALDDANSTIEGTKEQAESQQSQPSESILGKLNPFK
jgi:phage-related tail protein